MINLLFLLICILFSIQTKNAYDYLLEWGKNNSLVISDKLRMKFISENDKRYYADDDIPKDTLLMSIPPKIMLNLDNALELLNSKKINKLYDEYKKNSIDISLGFLTSTGDQTFLTYLIYLVNHRQKYYKKNKFYQFFHYMFDIFETNLDSFPIFYKDEQLDLLQGSNALMQLTLMKELYKDEVEKFEKDYNQKEIDFDEYLRYRSLIITKSLNVSQVSIIPFMDLFASDPIDYNVDFGVNYTTGNIDIFTTKKVRRDDVLYIRSGYFSNTKRFVLYGETFDKLQNYVDNFHVPMVSFKLLKNYHLNEKDFDFENTIDLSRKKFYKYALKAYKKVSLLKKEDGSDLSAYKLFLKNLKMVRDSYAPITTSDIHKQFVNIKDIDNVRRVLDFEKKFLDDKIKELKKVINKMENSKKNNDL
jgi:hypothetical protein